MTQQAVVLFSAGLDCTVSLALAREQGLQLALGLVFDYGQQAAEAEWRQAQVLARHFDLPLRRLALPWLGEITETALAKGSQQALPEVSVGELDSIATVTLASAQKVWVPNRNGLLINIAAAFADRYDYQAILTGFNAEEAATFPDNTPQFADAATRALAFSTQVQPVVRSYVQHLNKVEIVGEARRLQLPLTALWSCYRDGERHCGRCESCSRLRRALQANGCESERKEIFGTDA